MITGCHVTRKVTALIAAACGFLSFIIAIPPRLQAQSEGAQDTLAILKKKCFQCHSGTVQMSSLNLETREGMLKGGDKGPALVPGNAAESRLYRRVAGLDQPKMPMAPLAPLTEQEIAIVKSWIDQGAGFTSQKNDKANAASYDYKERTITAEDRAWWAFQKPKRHPIPEVSDARWNANPIDAFIRKALDQQGLEPAPEADRNTLIRRAYLDLTGLLPAPEEVDAFVNDSVASRLRGPDRALARILALWRAVGPVLA